MARLEIVDRPGPESYDSTLSVQYNILDAKIADRLINEEPRQLLDRQLRPNAQSAVIHSVSRSERRSRG